MRKIIKSIFRGTPHGLSYCNDCSFGDGANGSYEISLVRNKLFKHLRQTGHSGGGIETGMVSHYQLSKLNN